MCVKKTDMADSDTDECVLCGGAIVPGTLCEQCAELGSLTMRQWLTSVLFHPLIPQVRSYSFVQVDLQPDPNNLLDLMLNYDPSPVFTRDIMDMMLAPTTASGQCAVCLDEMAEQACARLPCEHTFHSACVETWLQTHDSCPLCRDSLNERFARLELD